MKRTAPIIPARKAGAKTVPVTVSTPGQPDEVWHMSRNIWLAFEAMAEKRGVTIDQAVDELLRKAHAESEAAKKGGSK